MWIFGQQALAYELTGWGGDYVGQITDIPPGNDFIAIAAGDEHGVALKANGTVVAWGNDTYGQVTNVPSGTDSVAVVAGDTHAVALRSNESVVSWGDTSGTSGQPTSGTFTQVSASHDFCLALASDGSIAHWGDDPWSYGVDEVPPGTV